MTDRTQAFYITLDLSTRVPPAAPLSRAQKTATDRHPPPSSAEADPARPSHGQPDRLQVLDLHTANPIVSFNSQVFSCHWATEIGTTIFLAPPGSIAASSDSYLPLRSFPSFDLLAKSRARLVAVPAHLSPIAADPVGTAVGLAAGPPTNGSPLVLNGSSDGEGHVIHTAQGDTITCQPSGQVTIAMPLDSSAAKTNQARFLERWSQIRAQRGNTGGPVPIKTVSGYALPENWEEMRKAALQRAREEEGGELPRRKKRRARRKSEPGAQEQGEGMSATSTLRPSAGRGGRGRGRGRGRGGARARASMSRNRSGIGPGRHPKTTARPSPNSDESEEQAEGDEGRSSADEDGE